MVCWETLLNKKSFAAFLCAHYQFIIVFFAASLVMFSMGTYTNWDAQKEFEAAQSVVTTGFPYVAGGLMIDQAPFGFYMTAPTLLVLGTSYANAVAFVSTLGLGCVALIYVLGTLLYGKRTGLVASALFGIVPWQLFMSRIYLIDVQYLFLSLLFMVFGVWAVKANSQKLVAAAGVLFAFAFLTKLFAVFFLVPMLLWIVLKGKETGFKLGWRQILIFIVPSFILQAIWFGGFANQHFFGVYVASDLTHPVQIAEPSLTFMGQIYVESAGWFLLASAIFSLALTAAYRGLFARHLRVDVICFGVVAAISALDLWLVFSSHLLVPYVSAFKYLYAVLPFLCILAGSIADKSALMVTSVGRKRTSVFLAGFGISLSIASILESAYFINHFIPYTLVDFKVDYAGHYFPFNISTPINSSFQAYLTFAVALMLTSLALPLILRFLKKR